MYAGTHASRAPGSVACRGSGGRRSHRGLCLVACEEGIDAAVDRQLGRRWCRQVRCVGVRCDLGAVLVFAACGQCAADARAMPRGRRHARASGAVSGRVHVGSCSSMRLPSVNGCRDRRRCRVRRRGVTPRSGMTLPGSISCGCRIHATRLVGRVREPAGDCSGAPRSLESGGPTSAFAPDAWDRVTGPAAVARDPSDGTSVKAQGAAHRQSTT